MKPDAFLILTPGFAADENDSTCIPSQQIFVRSLKQQYPTLNVIIIAFQYPFSAMQYDWHGCKVFALGGKEKSKLFRLIIWFKVWRKLKTLNKNYNIKATLSFWYGECAFVGKRFSDRHNLLHKCWLQGQDAKAGNKYVSKTKLKTQELIALSDFLAVEFYKNYNITPAHIVPVGIDETLFKINKQPQKIDIIGVGSLISLKQFDIFIEGIKKIKETLPNINAMIIGKGPEENKLFSLISFNNLKENISLTGELDHEIVLSLMAQSKILLHTSSYEGFGTVCTEALYAGCKVISFTRPMKQEIDNWISVNTIEEMVSEALKVLTDKTLIRKSILPFSIEDNVKEMIRIFSYKDNATA